MAAPRKPNPETNTPPDDLRREAQASSPPDSMPPRTDAASEDKLAGGDENHPIHDDDPSADAGPGDYERELDRLDAAARADR